MKYEVVVELKEEVLDTQGRAIQQTLQRLGHEQLKSVKVSKRFVLEVEGNGGQIGPDPCCRASGQSSGGNL
jgi:phosphoribosylformylglycinamidine synthase